MKTVLPVTAAIFFVIGLLAGTPSASTFHNDPVAVPTPGKGLFTEYRGVTIGMAAADVRTKLGNPKDKSDAQDQYIFSDSESVLLYYDTTKAVNAIMITFTGDIKGAPTAKDVFGVDVAPNDAGMIFKMERYPKLGYWISYTRTTGSDQMVNIALQKM